MVLLHGKTDETMIICESEHYLIQCMVSNLTAEQLPPGDWFCPDCMHIVRMSYMYRIDVLY